MRNNLSHPLTHGALLSLVLLVSPGCGFSDQVNGAVANEEHQIESQACQQMLAQSDVVVNEVRQVLPMAAGTVPIAVPSTHCTVDLTQSASDMALMLATPNCAINVPAGGQDVSLGLSLADLSFAAHKDASGLVTLTGSGHMDVSAMLPVIGAYSGQAAYQLMNSTVDTVKQALALHMVMTYMSGQSMAELTVDVTGTRENVTGHLGGPNGFTCDVSGPLATAQLKCQIPN